MPRDFPLPKPAHRANFQSDLPGNTMVTTNPKIFGSQQLRHRSETASIELFTGAGGLALGTSLAGFGHEAVIEWNADACRSLRANAERIESMRGWSIIEADVRRYDFRQHAGIALLAAGAPCQPFSLGGKHRGHADDRNMFPEVFRAVREALPAAIIVENVKGLLRASFRPYFDYILAALTAPELVARKHESWEAHDSRLKRTLRGASSSCGARYRVSFQLFNAADYGVPQRRERVFIIAFREDLGLEWTQLPASYSEDALLAAKWVTGDYWRDHNLSRRKPPESVIGRIQTLARRSGEFEGRQRWRTVRDALRGLPRPTRNAPEEPLFNHVANPGARVYPGHTGSPWDEPAKTLKAGDHGVPGGENILRRDDGTVRYFTVREAARLQGFPDEYVFRGAWSEGFRQLGNAVPIQLASAVATAVAASLHSRSEQRIEVPVKGVA